MMLRQRLVAQLARRWHLLRRALPERHLPYPTRGGRVYLSLANAPTMLERVLRVYEPKKFDNITRFLPPGGGFVDVGASLGDFSLWAARRGGAATRVLAVEAEPGNAMWLRRTVERNRLGEQIVVESVAASDSEGETELLVTARSGTHSIVETDLHTALDAFRPVRRLPIRTRPLDDLLADAGMDRVDLVKIDVEGAELLVLQGATRLLSQPGPLTLLIDLHFGVDLDALGALLHAHGFSLRTEEAPDVEIDVIPPRTLSIVAVRTA